MNEDCDGIVSGNIVEDSASENNVNIAIEAEDVSALEEAPTA
jgi:tRNA threonylcarbamoyladenosine modification (KEOPS) complex  Pcc1 subunit